MKSVTMVILAAGLGRRYKAIKQMDGLGPKGTSLLEYNVYNGIQIGYSKVVFVLNSAIKDVFIEKIGKKIEAFVAVHYVIQDLLDVPVDFEKPPTRVKPWGTGHGVYAARHVVDEPFVVLNGDDYYGKEALEIMYQHLKCKDTSAMVTYPLSKTLSPAGGVSRGLCRVEENMLKGVEEVTQIQKSEGKILGMQAGTYQVLSSQDRVSMNLWGLHPNIFETIQEDLKYFLSMERGEDDELYLPKVIETQIKNNKLVVEAYTSEEQWFGVTYQGDKPWVRKCIQRLVHEGQLPSRPWTKEESLKDVCDHFLVEGVFQSALSHGDGHIHETYLINYQSNLGQKSYILQKINECVFKDIKKLMANIEGVICHLNKKAKSDDTVLKLVYTKDQGAYYQNDQGSYRMYDFIKHAVSFSKTDDLNLLREAGEAIGKFQWLLSDYPVETLEETIVNFHATKIRYKDFMEAVKEDPVSRRTSCRDLIEYVKAKNWICGLIVDENLPLQVSHNDTKLNNILFDQDTLTGKCMIDFDTIMPGHYLYDYGDGLRICGSTRPEDDSRFSEVDFDLNRFEAFTEGYLKYGQTLLSQKEIKKLPEAILVMTYECGLRFLEDYLRGDPYFKVSRPDHNLIRCQNQMTLVSNIEGKMDKMETIIQKILKGGCHG